MKLQTKIILIVISVSISVNFLFQYEFISRKRRDETKKLQTKIDKNSELFKKILSIPLYYYDINLVETSLKSFLNDPDIVSIYLKDSGDQVRLFFSNRVVKSKFRLERIDKLYFDSEEIGEVRVIYAVDNIDSEVSSFIRSNIIINLFINVIISLLIFILLGRIIKPIKVLTSVSKDISSGDLKRSIDIHTRDEIGELANSFIKMRDSINQKIDQLHIEIDERKKAEKSLETANIKITESRDHLEELVDIRTKELKNSLYDLKNTQNKLIESEKLSSLGGLVAGVAHEINTPVGIGVTAASHLESEAKEIKALYEREEMTKKIFYNFLNVAVESSAIILSNMKKAANQIRSFKQVAVDQSCEEIRTFNLSEYIDEILFSIHSKFKHTNFKIEVICNRDIEVVSYPGALSQVITNLLLNSLQHGFDECSEGTIYISVKNERQNIKVIYEDTGKGISDENIKKIFEPFFTTKRGQGGSGLGMNIVYNLVVQTLKGSITCSNRDSGGIKFEVNFPINIL